MTTDWVDEILAYRAMFPGFLVGVHDDGYLHLHGEDALLVPTQYVLYSEMFSHNGYVDLCVTIDRVSLVLFYVGSHIIVDKNEI